MKCNVEFTDTFENWWDDLTLEEQVDITAIVGLLEEHGPNLGHPHCSGVNQSKHSHMRELRVQHHGAPYRILYAFDIVRNAILLCGGNKKGNDRWYDQFIPIADRLYDEHIAQLVKEAKRNG
jgi:hypothetical protein